MKRKEIQPSSWLKNIDEVFVPEDLSPNVSLTVVVPVYNCSERAAVTLESIRRQNYPQLEVIVIDAGSTDHTLERVSTYFSLITRIYTVAEFHLPEMMNRALSLASGKYITFLFPGSFYLSQYTLLLMANAAIRENYPDLLYSGSIQKEIKRPATLIQDSFDQKILEKGRLPATIVASWFRRDLFDRVGKFNTKYQERMVFEFFCRCSKEKNIRVFLVDRVLVDFDYGPFSYEKHIRIFWQTWGILLYHFGLKKSLIWLGVKLIN